MAENTVKLHRVLRAPAQRIYRAFLDADAMVKWLPPHGFTGKVHSIEAEVGGTYKTPTSAFGTPTGSTTRTCPARCRRRYR
jgi:uncharacterized protein YndB with AHSA1/START domain